MEARSGSELASNLLLLSQTIRQKVVVRFFERDGLSQVRGSTLKQSLSFLDTGHDLD